MTSVPDTGYIRCQVTHLEVTQMQHDGFTSAQDALTFILAGKARVTLTSGKTGTHYTYKVDAPKDADIYDLATPRFVTVLNGPDNSWSGDWLYLGLIGKEGRLVAGRKGLPDAPSFKALDWALGHLNADTLPEALTIQHEGKCCRCGHALTRPESIALGIGPECSSKMGV